MLAPPLVVFQIPLQRERAQKNLRENAKNFLCVRHVGLKCLSQSTHAETVWWFLQRLYEISANVEILLCGLVVMMRRRF